MSKLKQLELLLSLGKITRREFIAKASALGLITAISLPLLPTPVKATSPKKGGRLGNARSN